MQVTQQHVVVSLIYYMCAHVCGAGQAVRAAHAGTHLCDTTPGLHPAPLHKLPLPFTQPCPHIVEAFGLHARQTPHGT